MATGRADSGNEARAGGPGPETETSPTEPGTGTPAAARATAAPPDHEPDRAPEPVPDPGPGPVPDPEPDTASASAPTPASASVTGPAADPEQGPATGPTPDSATGPTPDSATDPAPDSATDPAPDPADTHIVSAPAETSAGRAEPPSGPAEAPRHATEEPPGAVPESGAGTRRGPVGRIWRHPRLRWPKRALLALVLVLLVPSLAAGIALRVNYAGDPGPGTATRNRDALWLGHAWVDGRKKDADVTSLAARLRSTGIRDLYVHAGPLEHDGTLPRTAYPRAAWLIAAVHRELPGVRVQAWLGDALASEGPNGLRMERAGTRKAVVGSTRQILAAGFDGVHFDFEPLHSGNRDYLSLLDDLREVTRSRHVPLSVAAHQIDPLPAAHAVRGSLTNHPKWWSQWYFGQVARRVDQIALMSYDTALPMESLYGGYVAQQTSLALEVTPKSTDLLMGLPFFHEDDMSHHESAETVTAAVRGARLGLSRTDRHRDRFGLALYVDFAATEADWTAYREGWVR
ncbi:glycoside hydrolase family 18 protein [Streptomyces siamensis]|uniref:Glycoside hydrolase family 18 protein n=1 Tax=Streptomyces siamensis TaxID=1274986 RepID=A0ABP9J5A7_9ACTN